MCLQAANAQIAVMSSSVVLLICSMLPPSEVLFLWCGAAGQLTHHTSSPQIRTWKVSPELFPVDLSPAVQSAATAAVEAAVAAWGERAISELEAEDRLAFACEKAPTEDPVTAQVRSAEHERLSPVSQASLMSHGSCASHHLMCSWLSGHLTALAVNTAEGVLPRDGSRVQSGDGPGSTKSRWCGTLAMGCCDLCISVRSLHDAASHQR